MLRGADQGVDEARSETYFTYVEWALESTTLICTEERFNLLTLRDEWEEGKMSRPLDRNRQPLLLPRIETGLGSGFNLPVHVYKTLQSLDVFVVKIIWNIFFKSSCHRFLSNFDVRILNFEASD